MTRAGVLIPTLLHLPVSHLNPSLHLLLDRLWMPVNRKSSFFYCDTSTSVVGHPMTRKRRKSGNEMMIRMTT